MKSGFNAIYLGFSEKLNVVLCFLLPFLLIDLKNCFSMLIFSIIFKKPLESLDFHFVWSDFEISNYGRCCPHICARLKLTLRFH